MTARELLKQLRKDAWQEVEARTKRSHVQLKYPEKPGKVTVPIHSGDIPPGTLNSILERR